MSTNQPLELRRVPIHLAVAGAVLTGLAGAIAGAAIANHDAAQTGEPVGVVVPAGPAVDSGRTASESIWTVFVERERLREVVEQMPAGWPATEAMRWAADRARWRDDAERMPAGWPATEVMGRAGQEPGA
jgi:hypothetical protein